MPSYLSVLAGLGMAWQGALSSLSYHFSAHLTSVIFWAKGGIYFSQMTVTSFLLALDSDVRS